MASTARRRATRQKTLAPIHPNAGLTAAYTRRLEALIDEMHASIRHWMLAAYRANPPRIAEDASPADILRVAFRKLARRWTKRFNDAAPILADHFAKSAADRTDASLKAALKATGMTVEFKMTPVVRDVVKASVHQQVGLIKSIPAKHLHEVESLVMQSVSHGRDLGWLTTELEDRYGVTRRRAAFIATNQNAVATSAVHRARLQEVNIETAVWRHSGAGRHPRLSHQLFSGHTFNVREGALIDGERVWPGTLPNCRCSMAPVIPGLLRAD